MSDPRPDDVPGAAPGRTVVDEPGRAAVLLAVTAMATLPFASLVAGNLDQGIDVGTVVQWWLVTAAVVLAAVGAVSVWAPHRTARVGVVVAVATWLVFQHPALSDLRERLAVPVSDLAWWAAVATVGVTLAVVLARRTAVQLFTVLVAPILLLVTVLQGAVIGGAEPVVDDVVGTDLAVLTHRPPVVWFVLDGLAGVSWLRDDLGVATDPFVGALETDGFHVLEEASSNYPFTHLAVASALELELLYEGEEEPPVGPYASRLRGDNRVVDTFLANGYGYVHAYPGLWAGSRCSGREHVCLGGNGPLTETEAALLATTPLTELVDLDTHARIAEANDPVAVVEEVLDAPAPTPSFAFVHLLNPHPPYLRDGDCGLREVELDFAAWGDGPEYRDAVDCLFARLEQAVDLLLAADPDTVIVITGDHGPRLGLSGETSGPVLLDDRMHLSAFSAMRLPASCPAPAEDGTLVNTFRIVLACLAGEEPDLVEDRINPIRRDY